MRILIENVVDEISLDNAKDSHVDTFYQHLEMLRPSSLQPMTEHDGTHTSVTTFNDRLDDVCANQSESFALACLGLIEMVYVTTSQLISEYMIQQFGIQSPHYENHQELDLVHANKLFDACDIASDGDSNVCHRGFQMGLRLLYDLYYDLETIGPSKNPLYFANVYETSNVEISCIKHLKKLNPDKLRTLCITSGGDTIVRDIYYC